MFKSTKDVYVIVTEELFRQMLYYWMQQKIPFTKMQRNTLSHRWHLRYMGDTRSSAYDNSRRALPLPTSIISGVPTERTKLCSNRSDAHLSTSCEFWACEYRRGLLEVYKHTVAPSRSSPYWKYWTGNTRQPRDCKRQTIERSRDRECIREIRIIINVL